MNKGVNESIFSLGNLYFILIILLALIICYLISIILKTISTSVNEKRPGLLWIIDSVSGPLLMFVLNAGYGIGYYFLILPMFTKNSLTSSANVLMIINLGWLVINTVPNIVQRVFKTTSVKMAKIIRVCIIVFCGVVLIVLFYSQYIALLFSIVVAMVFVLVIQRIIYIVPKPTLKEKIVIAKKLVMTHLYISTTEGDEAVRRAIGLVKEAIQETDGTGQNPSASLSGFTPSAFDILIRYYVVIPEKIEAVKEEVNLNIIKKLKESDIKLSTA